jgi:hypothetical protein
VTEEKKTILYQVHVTDVALGHEIPIGPAFDRQDALEDFCARTNLSILKKQITGWRDARIVSFVKQEQ